MARLDGLYSLRTCTQVLWSFREAYVLRHTLARRSQIIVWALTQPLTTVLCQNECYKLRLCTADTFQLAYTTLRYCSRSITIFDEDILCVGRDSVKSGQGQKRCPAFKYTQGDATTIIRASCHHPGARRYFEIAIGRPKFQDRNMLNFILTWHRAGSDSDMIGDCPVSRRLRVAAR